MSHIEELDRTRVMDRIQVSAKFPNVSNTNLAAFKEQAARAMEVAKGEPGVLQYDWYFDDTQTVCLVRETYQDSEALLAHIANMGEVLAALSELGGGCELEMFGDHLPLLLDATPSPRRSVFRSSFQSK
jgi:quinol monooxygenase YgiN